MDESKPNSVESAFIMEDYVPISRLDFDGDLMQILNKENRRALLTDIQSGVKSRVIKFASRTRFEVLDCCLFNKLSVKQIEELHSDSPIVRSWLLESIKSLTFHEYRLGNLELNELPKTLEVLRVRLTTD